MRISPKRRPRWLLVSALVLTSSIISGCGHPARRALQGRWFGDSVENFSAGEVALATGWARGTSMEFSGQDITVAIPAEDPRKGKYEITSARDGELFLAVRNDQGAIQKTRVTLDGDHYLKWHVDDRRVIVMRKEH